MTSREGLCREIQPCCLYWWKHILLFTTYNWIHLATHQTCPKCIIYALDSLVTDTGMLASLSHMWKPVWKISQILHLFSNLTPERIVLRGKKEKKMNCSSPEGPGISPYFIGWCAYKSSFQHIFSTNTEIMNSMQKAKPQRNHALMSDAQPQFFCSYFFYLLLFTCSYYT